MDKNGAKILLMWLLITFEIPSLLLNCIFAETVFANDVLSVFEKSWT